MLVLQLIHVLLAIKDEFSNLRDDLSWPLNEDEKLKKDSDRGGVWVLFEAFQAGVWAESIIRRA